MNDKTRVLSGSAAKPVDLRIFLLVHRALRRDFGALTRAVGSAHGAGRGRALARYGRATLWRLEHHHHGEDVKVWPLLRAKAPEAAALLDALESEHQHLDRLVAEARAALEVTGPRHGPAPGTAARARAAAAWAELSTALGGHLDKEERQVLPLLGQRVTAAEWEPLEKYFIRTIGPRRLLAYIPWPSSAAGTHEREQLLETQPAAFRVIEALTRRWYARRRMRLGLPDPNPPWPPRP